MGEALTEYFKVSQLGDREARRSRDRRARELRKQGYMVKCSKWNFEDLAREVVYKLEAHFT